ncbi:MAG: FAD/NAD(P)-binding protein [Candidatus Heimdallarchaeota archaeon]
MKHAAVTHDVGVCKPHNVKVAKITELTHNTKLFEFAFEDEHMNKHFKYSPGQFVLLSIFGIGECPISITSIPTKKGVFELAIRNVGNVTNAIHKLKVGDMVGIKGPFGNGFPMDDIKGKDLLFICGGLGYIPLRSAFKYALANRDDYGKIMMCYGDRCPDDVLFDWENKEYHEMEDITFLQTVDRDDDKCWDGNVGVVTTLIPKVADDIDPEKCVALIVGPPIMYKFTLIELEKLGIKNENIFLSLERRMNCGVGKCCHCGIGDKFVCVDGPVFSLEQLRGFTEAL